MLLPSLFTFFCFFPYMFFPFVFKVVSCLFHGFSTFETFYARESIQNFMIHQMMSHDFGT